MSTEKSSIKTRRFRRTRAVAGELTGVRTLRKAAQSNARTVQSVIPNLRSIFLDAFYRKRAQTTPCSAYPVEIRQLWMLRALYWTIFSPLLALGMCGAFLISSFMSNPMVGIPSIHESQFLLITTLVLLVAGILYSIGRSRISARDYVLIKQITAFSRVHIQSVHALPHLTILMVIHAFAVSIVNWAMISGTEVKIALIIVEILITFSVTTSTVRILRQEPTEPEHVPVNLTLLAKVFLPIDLAFFGLRICMDLPSTPLQSMGVPWIALATLATMSTLVWRDVNLMSGIAFLASLSALAAALTIVYLRYEISQGNRDGSTSS